MKMEIITDGQTLTANTVEEMDVLQAVQRAARVTRADRAEPVAQQTSPQEWTPTNENINALAKPLRQYIHDLETRCDPAGEIQTIAILKENAAAHARELLEARISEAKWWALRTGFHSLRDGTRQAQHIADLERQLAELDKEKQ